MRVQAALDRFLLQLEADGRSPHTLGQYGRHVRLLISWLAGDGHTGELEDVTDEDLARFLTSPTARTTAAGANRKASSANAFEERATKLRHALGVRVRTAFGGLIPGTEAASGATSVGTVWVR